MSSLNKVQLIGRLGKDPEIRTLNSGDRVATLRIATSERWKDKQSGEQKEHTEWHSVSVFGGVVKVIEDYVSKGDNIYIEGQLTTRKWQDQSGQDRYSTEVKVTGFNGKVILLGGGRGGSGGGGGGSSGGDDYGDFGGGSGGQRSGPKQDFPLDDDIPFVSMFSIW